MRNMWAKPVKQKHLHHVRRQNQHCCCAGTLERVISQLRSPSLLNWLVWDGFESRTSCQLSHFVDSHLSSYASEVAARSQPIVGVLLGKSELNTV